MSNHYPPSHRILKRKEFLKFFSNAVSFRLGPCVVFRIPNRFDRPRLGVTVKTKGNSVLRNKIKRRLRESFRLNHQEIGAFDYNVVVSPQRQMNYTFPSLVREAANRFWVKEKTHVGS